MMFLRTKICKKFQPMRRLECTCSILLLADLDNMSLCYLYLCNKVEGNLMSVFVFSVISFELLHWIAGWLVTNLPIEIWPPKMNLPSPKNCFFFSNRFWWWHKFIIKKSREVGTIANSLIFTFFSFFPNLQALKKWHQNIYRKTL